jgi:hypothetical protein
MKYLAINLIFLSLVLLLTTCADRSRRPAAEKELTATLPQIKSAPCDAPISIDGNDEEWRSERTYVIGNKTAMGVCRDDEYLYIHLSTTDPELSMQIINFGFTVWLDPQGLQEKNLGIQFPVIQMPPPPPKEGNPPVGKELQRILDKRLKDIIIEHAETSQITKMGMEEAKSKGINATIGVEPGLLSYELQYPLHASDEQKKISICIETPDIDLSKMAGPQSGGPEPGEVTRLQNEASKEMKPKPPKITRISQWIEVTL